jgi:hypothetical protein
MENREQSGGRDSNLSLMNSRRDNFGTAGISSVSLALSVLLRGCLIEWVLEEFAAGFPRRSIADVRS